VNHADNFETLISPDNRECLLKYTGKDKDVVIPEGIHEIIDTAFAGSRDIRSVDYHRRWLHYAEALLRIAIY
jgi:hypothetical protein